MGIDSIARGLAGYAQNESKDVLTALAQFPHGLSYKGEVDYFDDLPDSGQELGDAYTIRYAGSSGTVTSKAEYAWGEYDGTEQWIQVIPECYPEYLKSTDLAWSRYIDGGETTPDITLPVFGTAIGTQTMIYSFTAASENASFTAPSDAMLIAADVVDTYSTGNTISYDSLETGVFYVIRFTCYEATVSTETHRYILLEALGHEIA